MATATASPARSSKRRRVAPVSPSQPPASSSSAPLSLADALQFPITAPHPYGARPEGDGLGVAGCGCRSSGLGALSALTDAILLDVLALLPPGSLCALAQASRALYVFAHDAELWRAHAVAACDAAGAPLRFIATWKDTYAAMAASAKGMPAPPLHGPIVVRDFYSDHVFQAWLCSAISPPDEWLSVDNVDRRSGLTPEAFRAEYEAPNRPVVLTDVVGSWPAMAKWRNLDYLVSAARGAAFEAGPVHLPLDNYWMYARQTTDESPLYVFDPHFAAKAPQLERDYTPPPHFEDLFALLGDQARPHHRWLIIGAAKSGSSFHVDPNGTSAWNACVTGRKKWIMLPPGTPPPGVHPADDGSEVTAPVSLAEWFVNFYVQLREASPSAVEFVAAPGDLVFVPSGWWHCVLNLDDPANPGAPVVALTQNFVSEANLPRVCRFLRERRDQVSGCEGAAVDGASLFETFAAAIQKHRPDLAHLTRPEADPDAGDAAAARRAAKPSLWDSMRGPSASDDDDDDDDGGPRPFAFLF